MALSINHELAIKADKNNAEINARITNLNELVRIKDEEIARLISLLEEANATVFTVEDLDSAIFTVESKR